MLSTGCQGSHTVFKVDVTVAEERHPEAHGNSEGHEVSAPGEGARCLSKTQSESEGKGHPMVGSGQSRHIANSLAIRRGRDVLEGSSDPKVMILVEKVTDVRQTIPAPAAARSAGVAVVGIVAVGWRRLRIMQVHGASPADTRSEERRVGKECRY